MTLEAFEDRVNPLIEVDDQPYDTPHILVNEDYPSTKERVQKFRDRKRNSRITFVRVIDKLVKKSEKDKEIDKGRNTFFYCSFFYKCCHRAVV